MKKLSNDYLKYIEKENNTDKIFGDWINDIGSIKRKFYSNKNPFHYVTIENFLNIVEKNVIIYL